MKTICLTPGLVFVPGRDGRVSPTHDPLTPPPGQGRGWGASETKQIATITLYKREHAN